MKSKKLSTAQNLAKILVIVGPTASGKTDLAIKLAKKFNGEIISADSRQIYRGLDIGTAKPTPDEMSRVRHYLIDIKNPDEEYTVAQYKTDCLRAIKKVLQKNKLPILVGGTGLYVQAVTENLEIPKASPNPELRKKLEQKIKLKGIDFLYRKLISLDPEAAYIVDPKNPRRIIRALEIALSTKKPFSEQRQKGKKLFDALKIGIDLPKEKLKERINRRGEQMIKTGLVEEVKNLIAKYPAQSPVFDAIGYREIIDYLNGKISFKEAVALMKKNSWHYAKRQMTWFKKDKEVIWINSSSQKGLGTATSLCQKFIPN